MVLFCASVFAQERPATEVKPPATQESSVPAPEQENQEPVRDPFESALPIKQQQVSQTSGETEPGQPARKVFAPEQFKVTGIVWGIEKAKAIINDQIVGIGDTVNEATIKRIDKEGILVDYDGQEYLLKRESEGSQGGSS